MILLCFEMKTSLYRCYTSRKYGADHFAESWPTRFGLTLLLVLLVFSVYHQRAKYFRNESSETILQTVTLRQKLQIKNVFPLCGVGRVWVSEGDVYH